MCGITGFLDINKNVGREELEQTIRIMKDSLTHRGPDGSDIWINSKDGIALGHQRLSIIDLSSAGNQPMISRCERFVIVYNGEVYNSSDIRTDIEKTGHLFRGHSDTEVILEACALWGIDKSLDKLIGMFAFALWDRQKKRLCLVRDRLGIKPLYWGKINGLFMFGSELKSLRSHPGWEPKVDRNALAAFMRYSNIPAPHTIYKNIYKLEPGTLLTLRQKEEPKLYKYWSMHSTVEQGLKQRNSINESNVIEELHEILSDSIKCRMISDVPIGAFLSGGIDSSSVAALMQANSMRPIKTFTVGFTESSYDEAPYARAVASYLGTEHTELYVSPEDSLNVIPKLADIYDEPFADSSQIPTYLISKLTREHVTVALSGDGGDEVFVGYNRYFFAKRLMRYLNYMHPKIRKSLGCVINSISQQIWSTIPAIFPPVLRYPQLGTKLYKLADLMKSGDQITYKGIISHWNNPDELVINSCESKSVLDDNDILPELKDQIERMQYFDTITYLTDDILTKVDRASMAVSLEARVPLLDHRIVEFSWGLPLECKYKQGMGKWLLRQVGI